MITQPIHAQSLKFVARLLANEPLQTVCETSQTVRKSEENFCAKYRIYMYNICSPWFLDIRISTCLIMW